MSQRLQGKVAVVTGGNSGIGLATAQRFAEEGAHVFITGRRQAELDMAARKIGTNANAGAGELAPLGAISEAHFDRAFGVNVKGLLFTVQKALPLFRDGGSIILNASIAGSKGMEAFSVYSATKAAIRSFARSWTVDLKQRRIRVNAISPGPIDTPGYDNLGLTGQQIEDFKKKVVNSVPLGRMGSPDEIAKAVLFLASDDSSFVS